MCLHLHCYERLRDDIKSSDKNKPKNSKTEKQPTSVTEKLRRKMAWACPPPPDFDQKIKFFCPKLDQDLSRCIRPGNITEIFGEAGTAKTQICLHLAVQTISKCSGNVLYVVTERAFPSRRVKQIINTNGFSEKILDKLIIKSAWESKPFLEFLERQVLAYSKPLDLIIIDSVAGPLR